MIYRLPPLNALRVFEAAARHLSFKDAAAELSITQTAVSHQVKSLEEYLGVELVLAGIDRALGKIPVLISPEQQQADAAFRAAKYHGSRRSGVLGLHSSIIKEMLAARAGPNRRRRRRLRIRADGEARG